MSETETNVIYCGDCINVLKNIPDNTIDLIYLDPPFFSQKKYENFWIKDKVSKLEFSDKEWEQLRTSINPIILKEYDAVEARWKGGHKGIYVYIAYMRERMEQCWRILKSTGVILLHCDWHAGHYLKVMMDEIFGYDNFRNQIVWHYRTGNVSEKQLQRKYDTILAYSKSDKWTYHPIEIKEYYSQLYGPKFKPSFKGRKSGKDEGGEFRMSFVDDVWDISAVFTLSKEHLGYPTQKPLKLLERLISMFSNEGDIVLDPFCGCGTTLVASKELKRKWIGIDISRTACDVMKKRLGGHVKIIGGESEDELKKMPPHEFARLLITEKMRGTVNPKKTGDMGIDGWINFMTVPVQVKRWGHKVGRPEVDKFAHALQREHKEKGVIVAFDFSKDAYAEVERIHQENKVVIELKTVKEIFEENV